MVLMIEKGIRSGICQATHRYAKANDSYGRAMSQKLPVNDFKWVKQEELLKFNFQKRLYKKLWWKW